MDSASVTVAFATIVVFGVGAQWLGRTTGLPSIVLLLLAGIIAGPVTGLVEPEELLGESLDPAITLAVGLLLFDSGLSLKLSKMPRGLDVVYRLISLGALITLTVGAVAAYIIFDMSWSVAIMLGAVLVVSGPTAVGPIVKASRPTEPTGAVLEWEGSILDPIGAALGAALLTVITTDTAPVLGTIGILIGTAAVGAAIGLACAAVYVVAWRNNAIPGDLQVPVAFMFAVLAFAASNVLVSEAGLFATLTLGLALTNQPLASVARIRRFESSVGTLVIAGLFIILAATVDLDELRSVLGKSALLLAVLVIVARPLTTLASTLGTGLRGRDRAFIASVAPRGIVAASTVSVYAITLQDNGFDADELVPVTFAVIIGAGIVYGFGSPLMARLLGVRRDVPRGVAIFGHQDVVAPAVDELVSADVPVLVVDRKASAEAAEAVSGYEVFTGSVVSDDLLDAFRRMDVGTALIGSGELGVDLVAVRRCVRELGRSKTFFVPRLPPGSETGIEARWRARTPERFVAFGRDVTRDSLRGVLGSDGEFEWQDIESDSDGPPDGTIPLFVVSPEGRGIVATSETVEEARKHDAGSNGARLLIARPQAGEANP